MLRFLPESTELTTVSYYGLSAGVLIGLAAALTGVLEASCIVSKQGGIYEADKKTVNPKIKTLFALTTRTQRHCLPGQCSILLGAP